MIVTAALALTDGLKFEELRLLMFVSSSCLITLSTFCASWAVSLSCGAIVRAVALLICQGLDTSSNIDAGRDASLCGWTAWPGLNWRAGSEVFRPGKALLRR